LAPVWAFALGFFGFSPLVSRLLNVSGKLAFHKGLFRSEIGFECTEKRSKNNRAMKDLIQK
jgi:hypothetical protein